MTHQNGRTYKIFHNVSISVMSMVILALGGWIWNAESRLSLIEQSTIDRETMVNLLVAYERARVHIGLHIDPLTGDPPLPVEPEERIETAIQTFAQDAFIRQEKK